MDFLDIDQTRCVRCGLCVAVCPRGLIEQNASWPVMTNFQLCIACGHCVAICPTDALENSRAPRALQEPLPTPPVLDEEKARLFLRSRRSIRKYKDQAIPRGLLAHLLKIARFAPSGGNSQGISYLVVDSPQRIQQISEQTIAWMEQPAQRKGPAATVYQQYISMYRQAGNDSILRNAPALIVAMANKGFAKGRENTLLALAYVELYAPSLGLGSCWAGLLESAIFSDFQPFAELLGLPADKQFTGAIMVGYPKTGYRRLPDRNPLSVSFQDS